VKVDRVRERFRLRLADPCAAATRRGQGDHDSTCEERKHDHRYDDDPTHKAIIS
jgi:hypothetical protein